MSVQVSLNINGQDISEDVDDGSTLLRFLRDRMRLTGTKDGCSRGDCGACTVLIDGKPEKACLIKVSALNGRRVETIESLGKEGLHPLQEALIRHGAVQCGFCTPGMIMAAKGLLDRNPSPSEEDIKSALAGNLCRCGGYPRIIRSVMEAAAKIRGELDRIPEYSGPVSGMGIVGAAVPDIDGIDRVTGKLVFADDIYLDGLLYGKLLLSEQPHAEILSIDTTEAWKTPGVCLVLTSKDVPGLNRFGGMIHDQPVLADTKVRFIGDVVAAVFAESLEIARKAANLIKVEYRPLEGVYSPMRAMEEDAPRIHQDGNVLFNKIVARGDVEEAFARSDVVVEECYYTPLVDHAFLEPEAGVAKPSEGGGVTVWYPTQAPFGSRSQIALNLSIPEEKVRVIGTPMGGAFGGKLDVTIEIVLALAALKTGRPVKITLTRGESLRMHTKRHAFHMKFKTGATRDGKFTALSARLVSDVGAYASFSAAVTEQAMVFAGGPYVWPTCHVEGLACYTNNVIGGAFRGFGINQVQFAVESQIDAMARKLGLLPVEIRMLNAFEPGSWTIAGEQLKTSVAVRETLRKVKEMINKSAGAKPSAPGKKIGIGVASGYKNIGSGSGRPNIAGAVMELKESGEVEIRVTACDMGQGVRTVLTQIAAASTGIDYTKIQLITGDSALIPPGSWATAQRQTVLAGNAVLGASGQFKKEVITRTVEWAKVPDDTLTISSDRVVDRRARTVISLSDLAKVEKEKGLSITTKYEYSAPDTFPLAASPPDNAGNYRNYFSYNYATQAAVVEVDEETGNVRVLKLMAAHDVGKAINPQRIVGQLEGSLIMGVGYALSEEFVMREGKTITKNLKQCGLPSFSETPEMEIALVEDPEPVGPFMAKGVSEIGLVPTVPAIINAIYDAVGIRITTLPANPERVRTLLKGLRA